MLSVKDSCTGTTWDCWRGKSGFGNQTRSGETTNISRTTILGPVIRGTTESHESMLARHHGRQHQPSLSEMHFIRIGIYLLQCNAQFTSGSFRGLSMYRMDFYSLFYALAHTRRSPASGFQNACVDRNFVKSIVSGSALVAY